MIQHGDHTLPSGLLHILHDDVRHHTLRLVEDLTDAQLEAPYLPTINPICWELGHVAFFYDAFFLGELAQPRLMAGDADLFDSFIVEHPHRWELPLGDRAVMLDTLHRVGSAVHGAIESHDSDPLATYLALLCAQHEDMHGEALTWMRQTLSLPRPTHDDSPRLPATACDGDAAIHGGAYELGAARDEPFVFDNEKWAHRVEVAPFRISRCAVTNREYAAFVEDGGYADERLWTAQAWRWRRRQEREHPVYWRRTGDGWRIREFEREQPLDADHPVCHVTWYEAQAYCRWARRRLPTEAEWEVAARAAPGSAPPQHARRRFPWGDDLPSSETANLDAARGGLVSVHALAAGDSAFGCRQMIGNVWEWTDSPFYPFPGYIVDQPYREYSAPWFGYPKVLKGGAWATRARLARPGYRNFFMPDRSDVFAGFRTCAL